MNCALRTPFRMGNGYDYTVCSLVSFPILHTFDAFYYPLIKCMLWYCVCTIPQSITCLTTQRNHDLPKGAIIVIGLYFCLFILYCTGCRISQLFLVYCMPLDAFPFTSDLLVYIAIHLLVCAYRRSISAHTRCRLITIFPLLVQRAA